MCGYQRASVAQGVRVRVRARCVGVVREQQVCARGPGARACPCSGSAPAAGVRLVERSVRSRVCGRRWRGDPGGGRLGGEEGCGPGTFRPLWKCELWRPKGLPPAAGREASACARRQPSPTSASRLFLVPGSQGPSVPGETQRRSPTPAGAASSHAPAAVPPERTDRGSVCAGAAGADMDPNPRATLERQQLRLRERQKFFEDILQPETEFVFPLSHLHLEAQRPPIGSISSMEVNVDTLEQVELIDLGDQDGADVFLPCEDPPPTPQTAEEEKSP
ncbi:dysbindin domain-containing protein 2 isoform 1-T1 [Hipposideros larvatus]